MTFLPIVDRELRISARRPMTFWLRIIAALAALIMASGLYVLFVSIPSGIGRQLGGPLFAVLTWMSFVTSLVAGLFFTSDALSEEKREGTMGLLFLTDLRGYDVVLGKLLASSCRCVFALLAIFPILAATQLLGGVEAGTFWKTILALLHTMFFALAVGIFISSISQHSQKALIGTIASMFLLLAGTAAFDGLVSETTSKNYRPILSLVSPITVFSSASGLLPWFGESLVASQIVAWSLLVGASLAAPRNWQTKAVQTKSATSRWRRWWRFGSPRRQQDLRSVVMTRSPATWLACRERWQSLLLWLVMIVVVAWFCGAILIDGDFGSRSGLWGISAMVKLLLYLWTASQACQFFAELKRAGGLELLLVAPLDFRKVAPGAWRGLLRLFGIPIGIILLVEFLAGVSGMFGANAGSAIRVSGTSGLPAWVMLWLGAGASVLVSVANFVALAWFGLWMGLVSRNGLLATMKTIAFVQVLPWLVITFGSAMILPILFAVSGGFGSTGSASKWIEWYGLITTVLHTGLTLGKDLLFWWLARRRLVDNFRATAIRAIVPMLFRTALKPRPVIASAPPIIPA